MLILLPPCLSLFDGPSEPRGCDNTRGRYSRNASHSGEVTKARWMLLGLCVWRAENLSGARCLCALSPQQQCVWFDPSLFAPICAHWVSLPLWSSAELVLISPASTPFMPGQSLRGWLSMITH